MTWPAPHKETRMKIKIVKKGTFNVKPLTSCPVYVDDDPYTGAKK